MTSGISECVYYATTSALNVHLPLDKCCSKIRIIKTWSVLDCSILILRRETPTQTSKEWKPRSSGCTTGNICISY